MDGDDADLVSGQPNPYLNYGTSGDAVTGPITGDDDRGASRSSKSRKSRR